MIESIDQSLDQEPIVNRSESTKTDSSGTPVHGIQSQKGSLHVVSPEGEDPPTSAIHRKMKAFLGLEGFI